MEVEILTQHQITDQGKEMFSKAIMLTSIAEILLDSEASFCVAGNSMMPSFSAGSVVGIRKRQSFSIQPGEVYVYETINDRSLKRLYYENDDPNSDTFVCYSDCTLKHESGPLAGQYHYPPFKVKITDVINLFTVVGVINRVG